MVCATSKSSGPACAFAQSDQSLCLSLEYVLTVKLLTEYHLEFLSLKGGCTASSESTLVKIPRCWKSHVTAQMSLLGVPLFTAEVFSLRLIGTRIINPENSFYFPNILFFSFQN